MGLEKQEAVATERKGMTTRSRSRSGSESASKIQKVQDGDQATKGEVKMVRCSQKYVDALLRLEEKPIRRINMDFLDKYTGSMYLRGIMLHAEALRDEIDVEHARILEQYRTTGVAYTEAVDEAGALDHP